MSFKTTTLRFISHIVVGAFIRTQLPSVNPYSSAVSGAISTLGYGRRLFSFGTSIPMVL